MTGPDACRRVRSKRAIPRKGVKNVNATQREQTQIGKQVSPKHTANQIAEHETRANARRHSPIMACYNPITAYKTISGEIVFAQLQQHGEITAHLLLPCGQCTQCRMQRVADWAARITHEAQMHKENCFVTLTYGNGNLPTNASLEHRDVQLFFKRLRKKTGLKIRYYACGEYGDETGRPHYHATLHGIDFTDREPVGKSESGEQMYNSALLTETWGMGNCTVQDLTPRTAAYCAGYIMKKTLGEDAETAYNIKLENGIELQRKPPYSAMSKGIGEEWLKKHGQTDAFAHDYIVIDGTKRTMPKYYTKKLKEWNGGDLPERIDIIRQERAMALNRADSTPERLKVREEVHKAKIRNLKRSL